MFFNQLNNRIDCNKFILYSKDLCSVKKAVEMFKKQVSMPQLNISIIDGDIKDISSVKNACETIPFMSNKRLVIIKADFLGDAEKDKNNLIKDLSKYISKIPDFTILIFYFFPKDKRENINKNSKITKLVKAGAVLVTDPKNNYSQVKTILKNSNIKLNRDVENYIIANVESLDLLINDINKLEFISTNKNINTIKNVFSSLNQDDIFDLTDAINKKDGITVLEIYNSLIAKGELPISILFMLIRQFKLLFYAKIAGMQGISSDDFAKKNKLHPYVCKLLYESSKNYKINSLIKCITLCINLEIRLKSITGIDSKTEVEMLLLKCLL